MIMVWRPDDDFKFQQITLLINKVYFHDELCIELTSHSHRLADAISHYSDIVLNRDGASGPTFAHKFVVYIFILFFSVYDIFLCF